MNIEKAKRLAEFREVGEEIDPRLLHTMLWLVTEVEKARKILWHVQKSSSDDYMVGLASEFLKGNE